MRLTLRTLLAWLDGVLPDDEQQQLGAKVSASVTATHLVERIRGAVGRSAIGAPKPAGRGLGEDANSVAEYLDNCLVSEQLEAFERICIESEVHLAEVAACHGLLAELSRDSTRAKKLFAEERERIHQRLLGLLSGLQDRAAVEQDAADGSGTGPNESVALARAIRQAMAVAPSSNGEFTMSGGTAQRGGDKEPPPRRSAAPRSATMAWVSASVATALLLALVGLLTWSLFRGTLTGRGGRRPPEVARAEEAVPPPAAVEPPAEPAPAAEAVAQAVPPGPEQPEPPDSQPSEPEAAAPAPPDNAAAARAPGVAAEPDADSSGAMGFVGGDGVLLRMAESGDAAEPGEWTFFPTGSPLAKQEDLLVPPTCQPELHVRGVTIRLLPETRAVLSLDPDGTPRLEVVFGRAVARASRADARLGISAAGMTGAVDGGLLNPVAIGVDLDRTAGADPASTPSVVRSRIIASRGLAWRQTTAEGLPIEKPLEGIEPQGMLDAGMVLEWSSRTPDRVAVARLPSMPAWIESGVRPDRLEKAAGEVLVAKVAATVPLARALREMAADKRAENRALAAATLALIGSFDDLVEQLSAESPGKKLEPRQWSQLEAATVPLALARGGNAAARLYESFADRGPHGKADVLWALARGVTDEELAAGADRAIVEALEDPSLIVRRYAIKALADITRPSAVDRARYRPDGLPDMRREGVAWWRNQLERGLIRRSSRGSTDAVPPVGDGAGGDAAE
jgi:hypothetical protein